MSKTVDELVRVFEVAHYGAANGPHDKTRLRAGIRAVIASLRDDVPRALAEVARQECCGNGVQTYGPPECCGLPNLMVTTDQVYDAINEILAPSEDGQAAGAERVETLTSAVAQAETPAAPAPGVICPHCNGEGCTPHLDRRGNVYPEPCQHCETTGKVPAATPAPVCVWVDVGDKYKSACGRSHFAWTSVNGVVACPGCKNPIEWEAQR